MATGGRKTQLPLIHEISVRLGPASPLNGVIGVIPAGGVMGTMHFAIGTAFNSTTNTLAIGFTPGGNEINPGRDIAAVARADTLIPSAQAPRPADTPIYWTLASTGPAPTTGDVVFWIDYLPGIG